MSYCASCGKLSKGLLCPQCYEDMRKSGKTIESMVKQSKLTLEYLEQEANRSKTNTAKAFRKAIKEAKEHGSLYGWE